MSQNTFRVNTKIIGKTKTAIYVPIGDNKIWIPISQLDKDSICDLDVSGLLIVNSKWASKHIKGNTNA